MLNIIEFNDVSGTILEPKEKTRFAFIVSGKVFLAYDVTHILRHCAHLALVASIAHSMIEEIVTDEVRLHGIRPVVDLNTELGVEVVHI